MIAYTLLSAFQATLPLIPELDCHPLPGAWTDRASIGSGSSDGGEYEDFAAELPSSPSRRARSNTIDYLSSLSNSLGLVDISPPAGSLASSSLSSVATYLLSHSSQSSSSLSSFLSSSPSTSPVPPPSPPLIPLSLPTSPLPPTQTLPKTLATSFPLPSCPPTPRPRHRSVPVPATFAPFPTPTNWTPESSPIGREVELEMDVDDDAGVAESKWARIEQWRRSAPVNDDDDECGDSPQAEEKGEVNAAPKRCKRPRLSFD